MTSPEAGVHTRTPPLARLDNCVVDGCVVCPQSQRKVIPKIRHGDGDTRHGTTNGYVNLRCHCPDCRAENSRNFNERYGPTMQALRRAGTQRRAHALLGDDALTSDEVIALTGCRVAVLARYGKIRSVPVGRGTKMYHGGDVRVAHATRVRRQCVAGYSREIYIDVDSLTLLRTRKARGLRQRDLAALSGISVTMISRLESGVYSRILPHNAARLVPHVGDDWVTVGERNDA